MKQHILVVLVVAWSTCLVASDISEAQGWGGGFGGGQGRERRGMDEGQMEAMRARMEAIQAGDVEPLWAALSFKVGVTTEQETQLKPLFQGMMTEERDRLLTDAKEEDWKKVAETLKEKRKAFDKKLQEILTDEQERKLEAWQKGREKWREGFRRRRD